MFVRAVRLVDPVADATACSRIYIYIYIANISYKGFCNPLYPQTWSLE